MAKNRKVDLKNEAKNKTSNLLSVKNVNLYPLLDDCSFALHTHRNQKVIELSTPVCQIIIDYNVIQPNKMFPFIPIYP